MVMPRNVVLKHGKLPHGSFNTAGVASERICDERDVVAPAVTYKPLAAAIHDRGGARLIQCARLHRRVIFEIGLAGE